MGEVYKNPGSFEAFFTVKEKLETIEWAVNVSVEKSNEQGVKVTTFETVWHLDIPSMPGFHATFADYGQREVVLREVATRVMLAKLAVVPELMKRRDV